MTGGSRRTIATREKAKTTTTHWMVMMSHGKSKRGCEKTALLARTKATDWVAHHKQAKMPAVSQLSSMFRIEPKRVNRCACEEGEEMRISSLSKIREMTEAL